MPAYVPPAKRAAAEAAAAKGESARPAEEDRREDRRGSSGYADRDSRDRDRGGKGGQEDRSGGRFDSLKEDATPSRGGGKGGGGYRDGGGKGGKQDEQRRNSRDSGGGKGEGPRDNTGSSGRASAFADGSGGDWKKRQDGRRSGAEERTELEVFGEVKQRSTAGIDFDKYDAIPVRITGNNVDEIKPIERFSEAKLTDSLFDNLRRCGYERPTPVQKNSIPIVVSGRDLMACAQTGSGKTCAFMVPCIESLLRSGPPPNPNSGRRSKPMPCGLCLAPTRELAVQIHAESLKFGFDTGIRCCIIYGGADMREQKQELDRGCDILIATPGRLTDMADRGNVSLELIQFFILDEADRMLDMGFEPQVRQIVENLGMGRNSQFPRQSMMFSATFARDVQVMAQDFLNDYVFIAVGRVGSASELVEQSVRYASDARQKVRELEKAINEHLPKDGLAVVFVETKKAADSLELDLHNSGTRVAAIHGDRSQQEREEALHAFKTGETPVLVATDVAARGLDIPNVALVVNFDMPKQLDDYVHRIGRTGRAGRKGVAIAFVNERCNYLPELGDLLKEAKQTIPVWFQELCEQAAKRGPGGKGVGRRENRFGGSDLRMDAGPGGIEVKPAASTSTARSTTTSRGPNAWGNSGQEDAW